MIPSKIILVDSNYLRLPGLREFLKKSSENAIVLDHLVLFEMFKKNPLLTSQESLCIVAEFSKQIYVIKPTHIWLKTVISSDGDLEELIDRDATRALRSLCAGLFVTPIPDDIMSYLMAREAEATSYIKRLSDELWKYDDILREKAASFSANQLAEIRTGNGISNETRSKISDLLHEIAGHFIVTHQDPHRTESMPTEFLKNMFAFRYALCVTIYFIEWIKLGKNSKKPEKRLNDIIDLQIATVSTFFSGFASDDIKTLTIAREAVDMLGKWGAFIRFDEK